jgi:mono/diheme cytochrome c family protein
VLCFLVAAALMPLALVVAGQPAPSAATDAATSQSTREAGVPGGGVTASHLDLVAVGQDLYALNCAVCHGRTGGGIDEAKLAFPADHRNCTRCHRPSNRVVQPLTQPFEDNNMFSIGEPPALRALPDAVPGLAAIADPSALLAYVSATMPRYDPGRMKPDEYTAVTAYLLALNDRTDAIALLPPVTPDGD